MITQEKFLLLLKIGLIIITISVTFASGTLGEVTGEINGNYSGSRLLTNQNHRISPSVRINITNTLLRNLTGHTSEVWSVAFISDQSSYS